MTGRYIKLKIVQSCGCVHLGPCGLASIDIARVDALAGSH